MKDLQLQLDEVTSQKDDLISKWKAALSQIAELEQETKKLSEERIFEGKSKEDLGI